MADERLRRALRELERAGISQEEVAREALGSMGREEVLRCLAFGSDVYSKTGEPCRECGHGEHVHIEARGHLGACYAGRIATYEEASASGRKGQELSLAETCECENYVEVSP